MDRRQYTSMAIMAGLGILAAGVAVIAVRSREHAHPPAQAFDAVRLTSDLIRLRLEGDDSGPKRRALKTEAAKLPATPMARAMMAFGDGNLEAAAKEPAENPFAQGLRGWILIELGRRPEAEEELRRALGPGTSADWEFRPLFEAVLKNAE
jgi:predicted Zn-dependent protease